MVECVGDFKQWKVWDSGCRIGPHFPHKGPFHMNEELAQIYAEEAEESRIREKLRKEARRLDILIAEDAVLVGLEAERAVLGYCFGDPDTTDRTCRQLNPDDFTNPFYRQVFETINELRTIEEEVTPEAIHQEIMRGPIRLRASIELIAQIADRLPDIEYPWVPLDELRRRTKELESALPLGNEPLIG
jgi:hypothetical protein